MEFNVDSKIVADYKNWFENYVNYFKNEDEEVYKNISLKNKHSFFVSSNIVEISKSMNLSEEDISIAEIIGLLHDIGRFEQFAKYRTFADNKSINHAKHGIEILEKYKVLSQLDKNTEDIIINSILNHNTRIIDKNLNERSALFAKLIRDADKLDIYRIFAEYYNNTEKDRSIVLELGEENNISQNLIEDIMSGNTLKYEDLIYINDFKLLQLSWIFDINFFYSFDRIYKNNYLEIIYRELPKDQRIEMIFNKIQNYLLDKCYLKN